MAKSVPRKKDLPVTQGMFLAFKDELYSVLSSKFSEMNARFAEVDANMSKIDAKYHQLILLTEEQRNHNSFSLDAARHTMDEMIGVKSRLDKVEKAAGI